MRWTPCCDARRTRSGGIRAARHFAPRRPLRPAPPERTRLCRRSPDRGWTAERSCEMTCCGQPPTALTYFIGAVNHRIARSPQHRCACWRWQACRLGQQLGELIGGPSRRKLGDLLVELDQLPDIAGSVPWPPRRPALPVDPHICGRCEPDPGPRRSAVDSFRPAHVDRPQQTRHLRCHRSDVDRLFRWDHRVGRTRIGCACRIDGGDGFVADSECTDANELHIAVDELELHDLDLLAFSDHGRHDVQSAADRDRPMDIGREPAERHRDQRRDFVETVTDQGQHRATIRSAGIPPTLRQDRSRHSRMYIASSSAPHAGRRRGRTSNPCCGSDDADSHR